MASFTENVTVVNRLSDRVYDWELCEPVSYYLTEPEGDTVVVPPGFVTDFASVPRPFWWWIAPWGRHGRAAIVHDFLYQRGSVTAPGGGTRRPSKRESDRIFRQAMAVLDLAILNRHPLWQRFPRLAQVRLALAVPRRWLMWAAVALFGGPAYRHRQVVGTAPGLEAEMRGTGRRG